MVAPARSCTRLRQSANGVEVAPDTAEKTTGRDGDNDNDDDDGEEGGNKEGGNKERGEQDAEQPKKRCRPGPDARLQHAVRRPRVRAPLNQGRSSC